MKLVIPRRLFFAAFSRQAAHQRYAWLQNFRFERILSFQDPKEPPKDTLLELEQVSEAGSSTDKRTAEASVSVPRHRVTDMKLVAFLLIWFVLTMTAVVLIAKALAPPVRTGGSPYADNGYNESKE